MRYAKTEAGLKAMKDRTLALTAKQRAALVLCDAKRPREQVLHNLTSVGSSVEDLAQLQQLGLVEEVLDPAEQAEIAAQERLSSVPPLERFRRAYPIATELASALGLKGFGLTLAVERSENYEQLCSVAGKLRRLLPPERYATLHQALYQ